MKRILFVDDQEMLLEALEAALRPRRGVWRMFFARGAEAALAEFDRGGADAVVTDLRMPGMDGAALLERVRERSPETVRVILSGEEGFAASQDRTAVAHRRLQKPCDTQKLAEALETEFAARDAASKGRGEG